MLSLVKLPDLLIYIRSSVPHLIEHIQRRGRDYEQTMRIDYLRGLNERYEDWIKTYNGELMMLMAIPPTLQKIRKTLNVLKI